MFKLARARLILWKQSGEVQCSPYASATLCLDGEHGCRALGVYLNIAAIYFYFFHFDAGEAEQMTQIKGQSATILCLCGVEKCCVNESQMSESFVDLVINHDDLVVSPPDSSPHSQFFIKYS